METVIKALLFIFLFPLLSFGQETEKLITIRAVDQPLGKVLEEVSKKNDILFSYDPSRIPVNNKVTVNINAKPLSYFLNTVLLPLDIKWTVKGKQIVLRYSPPSDKAQYYTVSGFVRDSSNGEILIGASVYDPLSKKGTLTNAYGFFSLNLPSAAYNLRVSMIGYRTKSLGIDLSTDFNTDLNLAPAFVEINEVEIVGGKNTLLIETEAGGMTSLSSSGLKRMTGFAGNPDVVRSLQSIPGIQGYGDGSAFFYVRGGNRDQNILLIDDAPVFNPAHLLGFYTAFAPDAIKDVKTYKGDLPARLGGSLSSVTDIRVRDGNMKNIAFAGNIGIFTSDLSFEGPLLKETSSFLFSVRNSNLGWLTSSVPVAGESLTIRFFDVTAKLNFRINDRNRILLTGFSGGDSLSRKSDSPLFTHGLSWDNGTATLRWTHILSNRVFINTTALYSFYKYFMFLSKDGGNYWASSIKTGTLKSDLTWFVNPSNTYKAGIEATGYKSNPGNVYYADNQSGVVVPEVPKYQTVLLTLYASNDRTFFNRLTVKAGLRLSASANLGPSTVYFYDAGYNVSDTIQVPKGSYYSPYLIPEPRLYVNYKLRKNYSISAGYTRTSQQLQMLSNNTGPFTSLEVWVPSGPVIKPQTADQVSAGWAGSYKVLGFSIGGYYRKLYNQIDYEDHANMLYNPLLEGELRFGDMKAYGIELLVKKAEGKLNGWMGYTWSRALRTIEGINGSKEFPAAWDYPHSISLNLMFKPSERWDLAAAWVLRSGAPSTPVTGFMQYNGYVVPLYGERNSERYPAYHRLDFSASFRLNRKPGRFSHHLVLSVYNAYGRSNPFSYSFNKIMDDNGNFVVPVNLNGQREIIPTSISVAGIIPSLNYTFRY